MPRRACGTEIKSGPPSFPPSLPSSHPPSPTLSHTHFSSLPFVEFSFSTPPPPPPPPSLFFEAQPSLFYGHSYCSADSVMSVYGSICEIGGARRQGRRCSITGAGHFHSPRPAAPSPRWKNRCVTSAPNSGQDGPADKENLSPPPTQVPPHNEAMGRLAVNAALYLSRRRHVSSDPAPTL